MGMGMGKRAPEVIMVPVLPIGAQVKGHKLHLKMPDGSYYSKLLSYKTDPDILAAIHTVNRYGKEASYSGSGKQYAVCTVTLDPACPGWFVVTLKGTLVAIYRGVVVPVPSPVLDPEPVTPTTTMAPPEPPENL